MRNRNAVHVLVSVELDSYVLAQRSRQQMCAARVERVRSELDAEPTTAFEVGFESGTAEPWIGSPLQKRRQSANELREHRRGQGDARVALDIRRRRNTNVEHLVAAIIRAQIAAVGRDRVGWTEWAHEIDSHVIGC